MVLFDVLPIPLLSLAAFVAIIILLLKAHGLLNQNNHQTRNTL
jgi:hypothetical protein